MTTKTGVLKRYKVKAEYKQLFKNLGTGEVFAQKEAFLDHSTPQGKAYQNGDDPARDEAILKRLEAAGFLDVEEENISYVEKG